MADCLHRKKEILWGDCFEMEVLLRIVISKVIVIHGDIIEYSYDF